MTLTPAQEAFLADARYSDVEANRQLFPDGLPYADYVLAKRQMDAKQKPAKSTDKTKQNRDGRGRFIQTERPNVILPDTVAEGDGRALWTAVQDFQVAHRAEIANQIKTDVEIKVDTNRPFGVAFMSDWHIGSLGTDHAALLRDIELINSCDNLVAYVGGDPVDNFIPEKFAHAARDGQIVSPNFQWRMFRYAIEKLQPSLMAVGRGNHDAWTSRNASIEGITQALRGIPVLHTGEDTYIDLKVGEMTYTIYRKHRPIGSSRTNRTAGAKRSYDLGRRTFDVGVTEHHHEAAYSVEQRHGHYRYFITTGSYKVEDSHAAEWGFHHGGIGVPVVIFYPFRKKMIVYLNLEDAIERLSL